MDKEKENQQEDRTQNPETTQTSRTQEKPQRSSAFNEREPKEEKSTVNLEEEADLEQQRKDALTERD